jgi:hypothetical protein
VLSNNDVPAFPDDVLTLIAVLLAWCHLKKETHTVAPSLVPLPLPVNMKRQVVVVGA